MSEVCSGEIEIYLHAGLHELLQWKNRNILMYNIKRSGHLHFILVNFVNHVKLHILLFT